MIDFFVGLFKTDPNNIALGVLVVCLVLFFYSFKKERIREISPALMVSAGIIGTFWGTFIALSEFPAISGANGSDDIIESIPPVLNGMKSAFVTSLIGLISAFVSRTIFSLAPQAQQKEDPIEKSTRELLEAIRDGINGQGDNSLSSRMQALTVENRDSMSEVKQSLSGENESSVVSQLIKLRDDNHEGFKNLNQQMAGLSEVIRESLVEGMKDLIKELRVVIVDQLAAQLEKTNELLRVQLTEMLDRIETALIDQFGKTFIEFNAATQAIKKWQEEHIVHVAQLTEAFDKSAEGIGAIRADCERIPATMESLQNLMEKMGLLIGDLNVRLEAFADMKKQAEESFPLIKENLDKIGGDLKESAAGFAGLDKTIQDTFVNATGLMQTHTENTQQYIENVGDSLTRVSKESIEKMQEALNQMSENVLEQVKTSSAEMMADTSEMSKVHREQIEQSMNTVIGTMHRTSDEAFKLSKESMEQMQKALNQVSESVLEQVKVSAEGMMAETSGLSKVHREQAQQIMNTVIDTTQRTSDEVLERLADITEEYAQKMNDEMSDIGKRWGRVMVGAVDVVAEEVNNLRGSRNS